MRKIARNSIPRRIFLRNAIRASAATAITGAAVSSGGAMASEELSETGSQKPESKGYQVSQHVLDYYKSAAE